MLNLAVKRITALLLPEAIDEQQRDLCEYGCELFLPNNESIVT